MKEKMSLLVILMNVLLLSITASLSYGNPLPVPFKPQVPPGQWAATNNCGQTATLTETVPEMSTDYFPIGDPNWAPNWYIAEGRLFFSDPNGEAGTVQFLFADLTPETKYLPTALSGPFSVSVSTSAEGGDKGYVYGLQVFCVDPNTGKIDSEHSPRIAITPGAYRIDKNNGLGEVIVDWTMSPLVTGKNDLLKIERDNNTLNFYINNEQVASSNFGGCTNVFLGLFSSSNVKASFDDFTVVTPVIQTGHPSNPLPALPLDNTGVVNPAANTIAVLPGEITIQPSMSIPEGDQGQQAQLLMYIYLPDYNTGIPLFNGPTVTLGNIISFDSFFSGPIDCSTCSGLTADIYYGYSLPGGDIKYNAYELKISQ